VGRFFPYIFVVDSYFFGTTSVSRKVIPAYNIAIMGKQVLLYDGSLQPSVSNPLGLRCEGYFPPHRKHTSALQRSTRQW